VGSPENTSAAVNRAACKMLGILPLQVLNIAYMSVFTRLLGHFLQSSVAFYCARFMVRV
jgi:hypothetical protein